MRLSPDELIFWQYGFLKLNATIVFTWGLMFVLAVGSWLITRKLSIGLAIGCLNAWHWVAKEDKEMREEQEDDAD